MEKGIIGCFGCKNSTPAFMWSGIKMKIHCLLSEDYNPIPEKLPGECKHSTPKNIPAELILGYYNTKF